MYYKLPIAIGKAMWIKKVDWFNGIMAQSRNGKVVQCNYKVITLSNQHIALHAAHRAER